MTPISIISFGATVWRALKPWKRLKVLRNKRRAKRGKPPLPITEEDELMFPKGTQTYTGIAILFLTPWAAKYGIGSEEVTTIIVAVGGVVGGLIAIFGRIRAGRTTP